MAYLDPKGEGDLSMPLKRRLCPDVRGGAARDPRDMAKAGLPESQSPAVVLTLVATSPQGNAVESSSIVFLELYLPPGGRWRATPEKGMSGTPNWHSKRSAWTEHGIAYRTRVPRQRSLRSSQRWGKPTTRRRETGVEGHLKGEGGESPEYLTRVGVPHWRAGCA